MNLNAFEWTVVIGFTGLVVMMLGFFLTRLINTMDRIAMDLHELRTEMLKNYVTKDELKERFAHCQEVCRD